MIDCIHSFGHLDQGIFQVGSDHLNYSGLDQSVFCYADSSSVAVAAYSSRHWRMIEQLLLPLAFLAIKFLIRCWGLFISLVTGSLRQFFQM